MRGLTRSLAAAGALSAAFVSGVAVAGGFSSPHRATVVDDAGIRPVGVTGPDALTSFDDCAALLDWYVARNLPDVTAYGWKRTTTGSSVADGRAPIPLAGLAQLSRTADRDTARTPSETGTNTQEVGVDEPDTAKTDGRLVVHLDRPGQRIVVTDVSAAKPRRVSSLRVPADLGQPELVLAGTRLLVVSSGTSMLYDRVGPWPSYPGGSRIVDVDLSEPTAPRVRETWEYDGQVESVRQYGDVVRVVVGKPRPDFAWTAPGAGISKADALRRNRELVRESTLADWVPSVTGLRGRDTTEVACADVHAPKDEDAGTGTTAVFTWSGGRATALAVAADAGVVYSSPERLYVATTALSGDLGGWVDRPTDPLPARTSLHSFALDGARTTYVASGHVDGSIRDRWSLDEQDGRLRVAYARTGNRGRSRDNAVAVLSEHDGRLLPDGSVTGLGVREDIQSVRWYDGFAVVVTFRQVDPLYTISFADPQRPRLVGHLELPGFSSYLHPIGGDLALGIGQQGGVAGGKVALFDLSSLAKPRQVARALFSPGSDMLAGTDPRAFTWLPSGAGEGRGYALVEQGWVALPLVPRRGVVAPPRREGVGVALLRVDGHRLTARMLPTPAEPDSRILAIDGGRVVLVGRGVRLLP